MAGKASKPTFLRHGLLLLLPVVVFACVGLMLLRRDRMSVKQEALENARVLATQIADYIGPRLSRHIEERYRWIIQAEDRNPAPKTMMSQTSRDGADGWEYNVPMPQYRAFLSSMTNYGIPALSAAATAPRLVLNSKGELLWPVPYPPAPIPADTLRTGAGAKWQEAQNLMSATDTNAALLVLSSLATNNESASGETGIPIQPLADLKKLRLLAPGDAAALHGAAFELASNAITWPSLLTPLFLDEAEKAWPEARRGWRSTPVTWRQSWFVEEESRAMYANLRETGLLTSLMPRPAAVWTRWQNQDWLVTHTDEVIRQGTNTSPEALVGLHFYPQALIEMALLELLDESKFRTPPYSGISFEVAGRALPQRSNSIVLAESPMTLETRGRPDVADEMVRKHQGRPEVLLPVHTNAVVLAESQMVWSDNGRTDMARDFHVEFAGLPSLTVRVHLSRPEVLFSIQRKRERLFGGLIFLSILVAVIGCFSAYQAFRQQLLVSEMKSNFVSSVSHELRAPIASVRLMAESLERGKVNEPQKQNEYFRFIVQECRRLSSLIENVLDFSRIEQGRKQYEFEPTDLAALTRETVKLMEPYAEEKGVKLETSLAAPERSEGGNIQHSTSNVELEVDGRAIQQALVNLMDNAIKHSAKGQTVVVGLDYDDRRTGFQPVSNLSEKENNSQTSRMPVLLYVEDHGTGIPPAEHEKIFERFYRLGSELRRETQGVGIGLSIVRHIVEAHGGQVTVRSNLGEGSRFTIVLPRNIQPQMNADERR